MNPSQKPQSPSDAGELESHVRMHLETQLVELRVRSALLMEQIAALEADMATPYGDSVWQLILRDRELDLVTQRERIAALLESVLADTSKPPELRELHRQELHQQMDALTQRIAAVRRDEERAAAATWSDRQQVLAERKARWVAEQQEIAAGITALEALVGS